MSGTRAPARCSRPRPSCGLWFASRAGRVPVRPGLRPAKAPARARSSKCRPHQCGGLNHQFVQLGAGGEFVLADMDSGRSALRHASSRRGNGLIACAILLVGGSGLVVLEHWIPAAEDGSRFAARPWSLQGAGTLRGSTRDRPISIDVGEQSTDGECEHVPLPPPFQHGAWLAAPLAACARSPFHAVGMSAEIMRV